MGTTSTPTGRAPAGRPRTSNLSRAEQLRLAKQVQREREARGGQTEARIKLHRALAERLMFASRQSGFLSALTQMLESEAIEVDRHPQLKLLCWNRRSRFLSAEDAWSLYERNWRFIESDRMEDLEHRLIEVLSARFGGGVRLG